MSEWLGCMTLIGVGVILGIMIGLLIGVVLGYEEYQKNDGTIGIRTYVRTLTSADKIRKKEFKVPDLKKLTTSTETPQPAPAASAYEDEDLPF